MATPDMEVIKEIPGYRVIMKAILKSQIQQLVEQLASHTDEESVILTASVTDGTLSHLGSDSGKFFLDDNEEFKSQFLGFCLKRHHRKKQEKEREEREEALRAAASQYGIRSGTGPRMAQRSPRMPINRSPMGSGRGSGPRAALRHGPYTLTRPRKSVPNFEHQSGTVEHVSGSNTVVKIEPVDDNGNAESVDSSQTSSQNKHDSEDDGKSNSSSSTLQNESQELKYSDSTGDLGIDSEFANFLTGDNSQLSGDSNNAKDNSSNTDTGVSNIKVEAISASDMDLEITGVELGRSPAPQDNWGPNSTGGFDQSGATGSSADMQGYNNVLQRDEMARLSAAGNLGLRKKKHDTKTLWVKYQAIIEVEKGTRTKAAVAKMFNIPATTLSSWTKASESIKDAFMKYGPNRKTLKVPTHEDVELATLDWFRSARELNIPVSGPILCVKAEELAKELEICNFKASTGWLERFKDRHGISLKKITGEGQSLDLTFRNRRIEESP